MSEYVKPWQIKLDMKDQQSYINTNVVINNANNTLQFEIFVDDNGVQLDYKSYDKAIITSKKSNGFKVVSDSSHSNGLVEILEDRIRWTISSPVLAVEGIVKNELYLINSSDKKDVVATLRFNFTVQLCLLAEVITNDSNYVHGLENLFNKTEDLLEDFQEDFGTSMGGFQEDYNNFKDGINTWKDTTIETVEKTIETIETDYSTWKEEVDTWREDTVTNIGKEWESQSTKQEETFNQSMEEYDNKIDGLELDYNTWKETIENWKNLTAEEFAKVFSFDFDNQFAFVGTVKETVETASGYSSVLKRKEDDNIFALQNMKELSNGDIEIVQKVFNSDGSVFRYVKKTIVDNGEKIVSTVEEVKVE